MSHRRPQHRDERDEPYGVTGGSRAAIVEHAMIAAKRMMGGITVIACHMVDAGWLANGGNRYWFIHRGHAAHRNSRLQRLDHHDDDQQEPEQFCDASIHVFKYRPVFPPHAT